MHKVKNKKVLRKIAWATIRTNKKKNAIILLAVILTSMMFTTLFSVAVSMNETTQRATMRQVGGKSMAGMKYMLPKDYEIIKNDPKTADVSYRILVGAAMNKKLLSVPTEVNYATAENAEDMFCKPTTGTMPKKKMDIAMSAISLEKLGIKPELGKKVSIDLQVGDKTTPYEFTLCGFWEGDPVAMAQEAFVSREFCDEAAPEPKESFDGDAGDSAGYWMIDFSFQNSFQIEKKVIELLLRNGYHPEDINYGINWAYSLENVDIETLLILLGGLFLILLAGVLIIYNIFYINIISDIHSYGLLKTIGTTRKQLKKLIRYEALFFCLAGILPGLLIGTFTGKMMFLPVVRTMAFDKQSYIFSVSPYIYLFSIVFTLVTVFVSSSKPGRTAAKVSAVEAVSYSGQTENRIKHKKARRFSSWRMAWSGLGRNKKRVVVVVVSLALPLLVFDGIYMIVHGFDPDLYVRQSIVGDFSIQDSSVRNFSSLKRNFSGVSEADMEFLDSLEGVEQSKVYWMAGNTPVTAQIKALLKPKEKAMDDIFREEYSYYMEEGFLPGNLYGVDNFALDSMDVYSGEIDKEKFAGGGYAIVYGSQLLGGEERMDFYKPGDTIELEFEDGQKKPYEVMAIAELPYPLTTQSYSTIQEDVCIPSTDLLPHKKDQGALYSVLQIPEGMEPQTEEAIREYTEESENLCYVSKASYMDEFQSFVQMFYLVGGALAVTLALIGMINFINTIVTGMLSRRQEFAMMEAVGMTRKQLAAMLAWEGVCYILCTIIFAVLMHFSVISLLIKSFASEIWFFRFHATIAPLLSSFPALLLLAVAIPLISCRTMQKTSVVERMRIAE